MNLKEKLRSDVKDAMRAGDKDKRNVVRMLLAAIKQVEIDTRVELDEKGVEAIITKQAKQRRESFAEFEKAGRAELAAVEKMELAIIETYLPEMMSKDDIAAVATQIIADLGVTDMKGMGPLMGKLMPQLKGKADGRLVNQVVRELLSG